MPLNPVSAKATLAIDLKAQGSQQLVVLSIIGSLIFFGVSMLFVYLNVSLWSVPLLIGCALGGGAFWCHAKSVPALDRAAAGVTKIFADEKGARVETNAITLGDETAGPALERMISTLVYRKPIPEADGVVMSDLSVSRADSAIEAANLRVRAANNEAESLRQKALEYIVGSQGGQPVEQAYLEAPSDLPPISSTANPVK